MNLKFSLRNVKYMKSMTKYGKLKECNQNEELGNG